MEEMATSPWPDEFFGFAYIAAVDDRLRELTDFAESEDWTYQHTQSEHPYPILFNYVRYTYHRVAEENKIALSEDGQFSCFNTGLVTPNQEPLYASFEANRKEGAQPWFFKGWFRRGQWELNKFPELPDLPHYFDDPTCLVLNDRKDFRVNIEHIVERHSTFYRAATCLTLDMAYNNARQIARPDRDWLQPQGQIQAWFSSGG